VSDTVDIAETPGHTLAWMRRIDYRIDKLTDTIVRHEMRLGYIERDLGTLKIDFSSMEKRFLDLSNEVSALRESVDRLAIRLDTQERMIAALAQAVDSKFAEQGAKIDLILAKLS
jgi:predicted  nucleic acid-binding Zn-ribbon protein